MNTESSSPSFPENDPGLGDPRGDLPNSQNPTSGSKARVGWTPPSPEELQALLPQYEILTMLGRGGMGAVYMGKQISLDRPVAIKILSGALEESDLGFKERFKNEARAMAKLSHPGIVAVHDFGETADGLLYIVMEYVDGTDVARMIASEGRLHTEYAMAITAHVCDALAYAHGSGIIHRDIKPANIMVGYNGVVKIADFGLAKVHANAEQSLGLTMSGMAMGTMHFMAPEALEPGVTVDQRADLYAVGVMLYQMLTGRVPRGMFELPSMQVPGLDPRYDGIISRAMREDREVRYQSAGELRADLDAILTQPVVKVEAENARPVAALPTMARPQRTGKRQASGLPSREARKLAPQKPTARLWPWIAACLIAGSVAVFLISNRKESASANSGSNFEPLSTAIPLTESPKTNTASVSLEANPLAENPETRATSGMSTAPSRAVSHDPGADWIALFNGVDLSGWEKMPTTMPVSVVDGVMLIHGVATREEGGHLFYTGTGTRDSGQSEWTDFEAIVTLKTSKQGNSGLKIHTRPAVDGRGPNVHGIEVNLWNEGMNAPVDRDHRTGSAFGVAPVAISHFKDGEWFSVKVLVEGKRLRTWLQKEGAAEWIPAVDWTQTDTWTPPKYAPNARLGSGSFAFTNWIPAEGEVWIREVKLRVPGQAAESNIAAASNQSFGGHRYQFVSGSLTWAEAKAKAESMGGHLATITTKEENEWLLKQFRSLLNTENRNIWLGAFETSPYSGWQWVTGEPFAPLGWIENEPNGVRGGGGQVGHPFTLNFYSFRGGKVGWNDSSTHESQKRDNIGFIVEWEAPALVSLGPSSSNNTEAEIDILGKWTRTNMETPGSAYQMELLPGGVAVWIGDNTTVGGAWKIEEGSLQVDWKTNFSFYLTPPSPSSPNTLQGRAVWPDGKTTEIVYEKQSKASPKTSTESPTATSTIWIDTQGRRLEAAFVRLEGDQVFLNVRDIETPILLSTLSPESQAQARLAHAGTSPSAPSAEDGFIPLFSSENASDWRQVGPGRMEIKDGVSTNGSPSKWGVAIYTKQKFANFVFKAEFRGVNREFNSGVWMRIPELPNDIESAGANRYEVGIRHSTGDLTIATGAIWREMPALADTLKPGEWNDLEITASGQRYVVKLNGQVVNDFTGKKALDGFIGLEENYEGPVQFRNVHIKPLP